MKGTVCDVAKIEILTFAFGGCHSLRLKGPKPHSRSVRPTFQRPLEALFDRATELDGLGQLGSTNGPVPLVPVVDHTVRIRVVVGT